MHVGLSNLMQVDHSLLWKFMTVKGDQISTVFGSVSSSLTATGDPDWTYLLKKKNALLAPFPVEKVHVNLSPHAIDEHSADVVSVAGLQCRNLL